MFFQNPTPGGEEHMKKKGKDNRGRKCGEPGTGREKRDTIVDKPEPIILENDYYPDTLDIQGDPLDPGNEPYGWDIDKDDDDDL